MASSLDEPSTCAQTDPDVTSRTTSKKDATSVGQPLRAVVPSETLIRRVTKVTPVQVWGEEAQTRQPLSWSAAVRRMQAAPHLQYVAPGTGAELMAAGFQGTEILNNLWAVPVNCEHE